MKRAVVLTAVLVLAAAATFAAFVLCARTGLLTPDDTVLRAEYRLPASTFIEVEGDTIHYVDEGTGPVVLLLHGSFGSLRMWNDWAASLAPHYRVIRFDMPPMGLSVPGANHYDTEHGMRLIDALLARLGVERFFLAATSSAGVVGAAYAAEHADRLMGLVLSNISVGPFILDPSGYPLQLKLLQKLEPLFGGWSPSAFWRQVLLVSMANPERVTPALAKEWADLNNRAQRLPKARRMTGASSMFARTATDLPRITVPTLLLWSAEDHEFPVATVAQQALQRLGAADKALVVVPDCGHIMPLDCGAQSVIPAQAFFASHSTPSP